VAGSIETRYAYAGIPSHENAYAQSLTNIPIVAVTKDIYVYANTSHQQSPLHNASLLEYVNCPKQGPRIHSIHPNPLPVKAIPLKRLPPII
jgi:hypothetical protein